ncbi:MAG TPA: nucleotidyltransferase domain-containing protein [Chloroflexota bacterium]|nr:nucleotidyltransferase domain-containing protein [Chloroflexota bacterium]
MAQRLLKTTGNENIDRILEETVGALESLFPGRVRAVYLSGSYASADAVPTSDVDGLVVFRGDLTDEESRRFAVVIRSLSVLSGVFVDFVARGERELLREGQYPTKAASRVLVYGDDVVATVPAVPLWRYTTQTMQGSWFYLSLVRGGQDRLSFPLTYPDSRGEFFGYERNGLRSLDGWDRPGLKALVGEMTLAASTLVAMKAGVGIVRTVDSVTSYRTYVDDQWTNWLEEIYDRCKLS